jgi:hypothetical protein
VDKQYRSSQHTKSVTFSLAQPSAYQAEDVQMESADMSTVSETSDEDASAAPTPLTYAHATTPSPAPPPPSSKSHQAAVLITEAEQKLTDALMCIEKATSLGGTLSPKLRELLGSLGSTVKEEELLKKVGDLVESKLAALSMAALGQPNAPAAPAPTRSTTIKSTNPVPIQPTHSNPKLTPKPKSPPKSGAIRFHPARLILQVTSHNAGVGRPSVVEARDAVNLALQELGVAPRVAGITYTAAENIVAIARSPHTSKDLLPFATLMVKAILGDDASCIGKQDLPWHRVQLNTVPVQYQGSVVTPEDVFKELKWSLGDQDSFSSDMMATAPRWMCAPEELTKKNHASVVFSFLKEGDANRFRTAGAYLLWGKWCKTAVYEERPQVRYCANCWSIEHPTTACRRQLPRCKLCAGDHQTDLHRCEQCDLVGGCFCSTGLKCCNCKGPHVATAYDCPERKRKLGQFAKKTAAPAKPSARAGAATSSSATTSDAKWQKVPPAGGRKMKKSKSKSKGKNVSQPPPAPAPTVVQTSAQPESSTQRATAVLRRSSSDPTLTPSRASTSRHQLWSDQVDIEMGVIEDAGDAASFFGQPFPPDDQNTPDL